MPKRKVDVFEMPLAFTDVETTGLDLDRHEIIEIGLVLVRQGDLEVIDEWETKVKPAHPERVSAASQAVNGFDEHEWEDAPGIALAISQYSSRVQGALFAGWNVRFDVKFLEKAFREQSIQFNNVMDYHAFDVIPLAMEALRGKHLNELKLSEVARALGIPPEPEIHRALNGARLVFEVYKKLREPNV